MSQSVACLNSLNQHGELQTHIVTIDSAARDRFLYPSPSRYQTTFDDPFKNVVSCEIIDSCMPENKLDEVVEIVTVVLVDEDGTQIDVDITYVGLTSTALISAFNASTAGNYLTLSERQVAGTNIGIFNFTAKSNLPNMVHTMFTLDATKMTPKTLQRFGLPFQEINFNLYELYTSGFKYSFAQRQYLDVRCEELDTILTRGKLNKQTVGFGKVKLRDDRSQKSADNRFQIQSRFFHPISKLTALTLSFVDEEKDFYNFEGQDHTLTIMIKTVGMKSSKTRERGESQVTTRSQPTPNPSPRPRRSSSRPRRSSSRPRPVVEPPQPPQPAGRSMLFYGAAAIATAGAFFLNFI